MADQNEDRGKKSGGKSPIEKLVDFVDGAIEGLKALLDPPRPVRIPVTVTGPRGRR